MLRVYTSLKTDIKKELKWIDELSYRVSSAYRHSMFYFLARFACFHVRGEGDCSKRPLMAHFDCRSTRGWDRYTGWMMDDYSGILFLVLQHWHNLCDLRRHGGQR